ncbi:hypothetical protein T11_5240, partial [Trichinella zimbabwensis]
LRICTKLEESFFFWEDDSGTNSNRSEFLESTIADEIKSGGVGGAKSAQRRRKMKQSFLRENDS